MCCAMSYFVALTVVLLMYAFVLQNIFFDISCVASFKPLRPVTCAWTHQRGVLQKQKGASVYAAHPV